MLYVFPQTIIQVSMDKLTAHMLDVIYEINRFAIYFN